jgi:hypothetical protein
MDKVRKPNISMLGLLIDPEYGGRMFLRNFELSPNYATQPPPLENRI